MVQKQLLALSDRLVSIPIFTKIIEKDFGLFKQWITKLKNNEVVYPFSDKVFSPLKLSFVTDLLYLISELSLPGVLQVSADKDITYADVAFCIAEKLQKPRAFVKPIPCDEELRCKGSAPLYTTLDGGRFRLLTGMKQPEAWEAVNFMMNQLI